MYKPVHERFVNYCRNHCYGLMDTQDLVQESILKTMQHFTSIKEKEKLLPFMISVANNIVRSMLRRKKFSGVFNDEKFQNLQAHSADPSISADMHYLYKALSKLPVKDKEAILLFEVSGYSIKEIAEIQTSNENATKTRLSRARQKLRELLSDRVTPSGAKALFTLLI
ncbi:MAG: RNA polymerase sigma factor [Chitinophagales bacterium]